MDARVVAEHRLRAARRRGRLILTTLVAVGCVAFCYQRYDDQRPQRLSDHSTDISMRTATAANAAVSIRAKSEHALSFAVRWRDAMAAVRWPLQRGVGRAASPSLAAGIGWTCVLLVARVYTSDFARPPPPTARRRCKATAALATKSTTSSPSTSSSNGTAHSATALRATPTQSVPHVPTEGSYLMRRARGRSHRCLPARSAQVTSSTYNSQSSGEGAL